MINQDAIKKQLPNDIFAVFSELKLLTHLRQAGITKQKGVDTGFLFTVLFSLVFKGKTLNQLLTGREAESYPKKDTFYRFMNNTHYNWGQFLLSQSAFVIEKKNLLANKPMKFQALVIDDICFHKDHSEKVQKLAWLFDHALQESFKGLRILSVGISDGRSFFPIAFSLLSGKKKVDSSDLKADMRTAGGKRLAEADHTATEMTIELIKRALNKGIYATHVVMDKWFTNPKMLRNLKALGIDVIGMAKNDKTRYLYNGQLFNMSELFKKAHKDYESETIFSSIRVTLQTGESVKIVFVQNYNKASEWLAIISSDTTLSSKEIIDIYKLRWSTEVFYKATKSLLNLSKESQSRNYNGIVCHVTIVFTRYIILSWQNRCDADNRTFGDLFTELCDELKELDWAVALIELTEILSDVADKAGKRLEKIIRSQVSNWFEALPNYIKAYLPNLVCET